MGYSVALLWLLASLVAADADTCATISRAYPTITVALPGSTLFSESQSEYWNKQSQYMTPTCILFPESSKDVARIIDVLGTNSEKFAIKGGGHMPNVLFNDVNGGPVINLSKMNKIEYDLSAEVVRVGPGNRWQDVANILSSFNRNTVGGRIGHVGVPGLLLGGGLSFLSTQYGWASTHVLEYEVVLANGTVTKASKNRNPDLYWVLQGGGNNFGVVTEFVLRTFPQGKIWGGTRMYGGDKTNSLLAAIRDFTEAYPDPKAGLIATAEYTAYGAINLWTVFFFYDGPNPPSYVFQNFTSLTSITDTTGTKMFHELMYQNNAFSLNGSFYSIATETMPLPPRKGGLDIMKSVHNHWANVSLPFVSNTFGSIASIAYQPLPRIISEATRKWGDNFMDMGTEGDRIILEYDYSYVNAFQANAEAADKTTDDLVAGTRKIILDHIMNKKTLDNIYLPLFMNDAYHKQDVWSRHLHGDFARKVKHDIDPSNFFGTRTQGFKL